METLKFKTDISSNREVGEIAHALKKEVSGIKQCFVDLDSIYNLLIVEGVRIKDSLIVSVLGAHGYNATPLYEE
ncbi:hypothetical protein SAMN05216436_106161 [bacterium A37T11]|nr:hypothetical protein SAMN05216436_106161 [bacterium A37T11]